MIVIILVLSTFFAIGTFVLPLFKGSKILSIFLIGIVIASEVGIIANDTYNWGMKKEVTTQTKTLVSSTGEASPMKVLLYQPLGEGSEKIYIYSTKENKTPHPVETDLTSSSLKEKAKEAKVKIKTTRLVYKNNLFKTAFGLLNHNNRLVKREYTFEIPKDWFTLSTNQAKELKKISKKDPKFIQKAVKQKVKNNLITEIKKNPQLAKDKVKQKAIAKEAQHEAIQEMINKMK